MTSTYSTYSDYSLTELKELLAEISGWSEEELGDLSSWDCLSEIDQIQEEAAYHDHTASFYSY